MHRRSRPRSVFEEGRAFCGGAQPGVKEPGLRANFFALINYMILTNSSATMLMILINGLMAGPAVSL